LFRAHLGVVGQPDVPEAALADHDAAIRNGDDHALRGGVASNNGRRAKSPARPSDHIKLIEAICDETREEAITAIQEHITHN
jgi:hypothetical protein